MAGATTACLQGWFRTLVHSAWIGWYLRFWSLALEWFFMTALTRRAFLQLAAEQSVTASLAATALLAACRSTADHSSSLGLDRRSTATLIDLIDEIIPASDGMPAASQAGTLAYFELLAATDPGLIATVQGAIQDGRTSTAAQLEASNPELFGRLKTYVYEGYYLQPQIWSLLGYEPYPTNAPGPSMAPFSPAMLQRVRSMPQRYRTV